MIFIVTIYCLLNNLDSLIKYYPRLNYVSFQIETTCTTHWMEYASKFHVVINICDCIHFLRTAIYCYLEAGQFNILYARLS